MKTHILHGTRVFIDGIETRDFAVQGDQISVGTIVRDVAEYAIEYRLPDWPGTKNMNRAARRAHWAKMRKEPRR